MNGNPKTTQTLLAVVAALTFTLAPVNAAEKTAAVPTGHADFVPTPENPIGARGDGMGNYEGATPPIEWWDGTPVQREVMLYKGEWDSIEGKPTMMWDMADNKTKNILWKVPVVGWAYAHPIVVGRKLYTVGHPYWIACYDADTGRELWKRAMTPMLAAGMDTTKAEAVRKVMDLALAISVINMGYDHGGTHFLFSWPTKREKADPAGVVKAKLETCEKALAMIAKHRADVEAIGDAKLTAALDFDVAQINDLMTQVRAATPQQVVDEVLKRRDRSFGAFRKAVMEMYDIPLNWAWYGYVGFADASLASDGERIYGTMAQGQIFAYDLDGKLIWAHQEGGRDVGTYYNFNRPPVVCDGVVMQRPQGHTKPARWRGYEAKTGAIRWEVIVGNAAWNYAAPIVIRMRAPDGTVVPVMVTPTADSYDQATKTGKGPAFIRVRDGQVLGYLPGFKTQTGVQMTWHPIPAAHPAAQGRSGSGPVPEQARYGAGILVCAPNADACAPPWAFRVWMSDPQTVASDVWADDASRVFGGGPMFPVGFGPYRITGHYEGGITDVLDRRKVADLPLHRGFVETPTMIGSYVMGRHAVAEGRSTPYPRMRADRKALETFAVIDLRDVRKPRLLSSRNVLGFSNPPVDHVIQEYLGAWDPLTLAGCYHGSASYFGTDMSGVVGHGDRIYIQSAAFLYCIGPAVKGTPTDDAKVVAAIRAAKSADEVAKYLEHDSAQYRYEAVKKVAALGKVQEASGKLETLAKADPYEEIRADALRALGLATNQPGFAVLRQAITNDIVVPPGESNTYQGLGDTVWTLKLLGQDADAVMVSLLTNPDTKVRRNGAAAAGIWPSGGTRVRDALISLAADRSSEQAARSHAIAAAEALSSWPADPAVTTLFTKFVDDGNDWWFHKPATRYLLRVLPEDQKNALLVKAARAWGGQNNIATLVERGAMADIKTLVSETKDRVQAEIVVAVAKAATTPAQRQFAVEMAVLALREPSKDLQALGSLATWIKPLGADAAPILPALKGLKIEDANTAKTVTDAITEIEAKVAAAGERK
jgi:hypothetical protein